MASPSKRTRVARLLLKAVRGLPEKEQQLVLEHLIELGLSPHGDAAAARGGVRARTKASEGDLQHVIRLGGQGELWSGLGGLQLGGGGPGPAHQMVPVRLSESQHRQLKDWCAKNGFSMAVVVRGLVERFLEDQERRAA